MENFLLKYVQELEYWAKNEIDYLSIYLSRLIIQR